ncbi:MAG: DUF3131 domain-containing protein [Nitrososphaeria archaeon]
MPTKKHLVFPLTILILLSPLLVYVLASNSNSSENYSNWLYYASIAWKYFQPGVGVNPTTGLNYAKDSYHYITDWDLGTYLMAVLDAERIGLISAEGEWGADYRINKIINFLKTRKLTDVGVPYWWYNSENGQPVTSQGATNPSDSGRLLISLYILKQLKPKFAEDVNEIVSRTNYIRLAQQCHTNGFYAYYIAHGFSLFGLNTPNVEQALNFIERIPSMQQVQVYSESLPATEITMEPILLSIFELELPQNFHEWAYKVYKVQEERYLAKNKLTAFTEGAHDGQPSYVYEWIVLSKDKIWYICSPQGETANIPPIVYAKAALGMHAVWNTDYTQKLVNYVVRSASNRGFYEGVNEDGRIIIALTDKTNAMIISAARYAIEKSGATITIPSTTTTTTTESTTSVTTITTTTATTTQPTSTTTSTSSYTTTSIQGYNIKVKVLDWDKTDPIPNAKVYLNNDIKESDIEGSVEWTNITGKVTLRISYMNIWVTEPIQLEIDSNKNIEIQCKLYDVYVRITTAAGQPLPQIKLVFSLNGQQFPYAITNQTGYAYFKNLPMSNLTLEAYRGQDYTTKICEWVKEIYQDEQIIEVDP